MRTVKLARRISKRERAEQTRARIVEAAYRLFSQHGYEATTMQAVADEAGVAVQTVYFTFHTKGGLVAAIETRAAGGGEEGHDWFERQHLATKPFFECLIVNHRKESICPGQYRLDNRAGETRNASALVEREDLEKKRPTIGHAVHKNASSRDILSLRDEKLTQ